MGLLYPRIIRDVDAFLLQRAQHEMTIVAMFSLHVSCPPGILNLILGTMENTFADNERRITMDGVVEFN